MVVKEALERYLIEKRFSGGNPYALGEELFGAKGSGVAEASVTYKQQMKKHLNEKHSH